MAADAFLFLQRSVLSVLWSVRSVDVRTAICEIRYRHCSASGAV